MATPVRPVTAQEVAEASRDAMWESDHASRWLDITVEAVGPGTATLSMTVKRVMLNGHELAHGGLIAALADSAFAFACNSYNELSVAAGFDVNLIAAARLGDKLTARAVEASKSGRTGVYDVEVTNQRDERVAVFRGRSYTMKGKALVEGMPVGKQPLRAGAAP